MADWVHVTPHHAISALPGVAATCHSGGMAADSNAVRSRRKRQHAQGDHSMCRHPRDLPVRQVPAVLDLDPDDLDPVAEMRALAGRLVQACSEDRGNAALARELRNTLVALAGMVPDDEDDELARLLSEPVRGTGQDYQ
jgi:hypothetical protein